ncbi:MAG: hypothetical protein ACKVU4_06395 [Phycisphaerales bacterium]
MIGPSVALLVAAAVALPTTVAVAQEERDAPISVRSEAKLVLDYPECGAITDLYVDETSEHAPRLLVAFWGSVVAVDPAGEVLWKSRMDPPMQDSGGPRGNHRFVQLHGRSTPSIVTFEENGRSTMSMFEERGQRAWGITLDQNVGNVELVLPVTLDNGQSAFVVRLAWAAQAMVLSTDGATLEERPWARINTDEAMCRLQPDQAPGIAVAIGSRGNVVMYDRSGELLCSEPVPRARFVNYIVAIDGVAESGAFELLASYTHGRRAQEWTVLNVLHEQDKAPVITQRAVLKDSDEWRSLFGRRVGVRVTLDSNAYVARLNVKPVNDEDGRGPRGEKVLEVADDRGKVVHEMILERSRLRYPSLDRGVVASQGKDRPGRLWVAWGSCLRSVALRQVKSDDGG